MSVHFEKVRIKKITRETPECVSITFDIPETLAEPATATPPKNWF